MAKINYVLLSPAGCLRGSRVSTAAHPLSPPAWLTLYIYAKRQGDGVGITKRIADNYRDGPGGNNNPSGINQYTKHEHPGHSDNYQNDQDQEITIGKIAGTSRAYTEARLERDNPELYKRVQAGELSANAAAIEAVDNSPGRVYPDASVITLFSRME